MREYSKKINLIQIINKKIKELNVLLENTESNSLYYIENVDINEKEVSRLMDDLDAIVNQVTEDDALDKYLEVRHNLDQLKTHIKKTKQLKEQNSVSN